MLKTMLTWLRRLLIGERPPSPRVSELAARVADVELELAALEARLEDTAQGINARITNKLRRKDGEDAPGPTIEEEPSPRDQGKRFAPTAYLSKRFRRF